MLEVAISRRQIVAIKGGTCSATIVRFKPGLIGNNGPTVCQENKAGWADFSQPTGQSSK